MKKTLSLSHAVIAILLATTTTSVAFAQTRINKEGSTNTGGIDESPKEGSTNVGGTNDGISITSMNPWNSGIVRAVKSTKQSATDNFADNKLETAIKIYELQLEQISLTASVPELQLSWTKKISDRALGLATRLDSSIKNQDDRIALFNVYATTYDLIEEFYTKLDLAYIIPYRQNQMDERTCRQTRKSCGKNTFKFDVNGYEQQLNRYLIRQGEWFAQRFVAGTNSYGTLPKYSANIFLVALSSLSRGLAVDLLDDSVTGPNLFPHQYESTASLLNGIADDIDQHLVGGSIFSGRDDRAINNSYKTFLEVMSSVKVQ